jgi:hypothetical protein
MWNKMFRELWIEIPNMELWGSIPGGGCEFFSLTLCPDQLWGLNKPPIQWLPGTLSLVWGDWGVELTAQLHLVPRSKDAWSYTSTPQYVFTSCCLVDHRGNWQYSRSQVCGNLNGAQITISYTPILKASVWIRKRWICYQDDYTITTSTYYSSSEIDYLIFSLGYGLDDRGSRVRFSAGAVNFSLQLLVRNASGAHPASYPMGTMSSFQGGKVARAWCWPLPSI